MKENIFSTWRKRLSSFHLLWEMGVVSIFWMNQWQKVATHWGPLEHCVKIMAVKGNYHYILLFSNKWQSAGALFRHITVTYGLPQCLNLFISNHVLFKPHLEFQCSSEILHLTNRIIVTGLFEFKRTTQSS